MEDPMKILEDMAKKRPAPKRSGRKNTPATPTPEARRFSPRSQQGDLGDAAPVRRSGPPPRRAKVSDDGKPNRLCKHKDAIEISDKRANVAHGGLPYDEYTQAMPCKDMSNPRSI